MLRDGAKRRKAVLGGGWWWWWPRNSTGLCHYNNIRVCIVLHLKCGV